MSEADIEYRGYFIDAQSYESDGKQWRPKALVSSHQVLVAVREATRWARHRAAPCGAAAFRP